MLNSLYSPLLFNKEDIKMKEIKPFTLEHAKRMRIARVCFWAGLIGLAVNHSIPQERQKNHQAFLDEHPLSKLNPLEYNAFYGLVCVASVGYVWAKIRHRRAYFNQQKTRNE